MSSMRCYDLPLRSRLLERTTTNYTISSQKVRTGPSPPLLLSAVRSDGTCWMHRLGPALRALEGFQAYFYAPYVADDGIPHQLY